MTTKLRYADFSIRTRSTTLAAPIDEADRIGELACRLLDRGLRDRPGALRLVGVGVSGLSEHRQLTFDERGGADFGLTPAQIYARSRGRVRQVGPPSPRREMWSPR